MVGWEQISHLFIDYDHNNLQFWILKPQWTYQPGIADVAWELRPDIHPVSGSSLNRLKSRNPYGNPIEITTWCWMPRIVPFFRHFPFSGPDLSHRWPFSPWLLAPFPQRWMTRCHRWRGENRAATGAACAWPGHRGAVLEAPELCVLAKKEAQSEMIIQRKCS